MIVPILILFAFLIWLAAWFGVGLVPAYVSFLLVAAAGGVSTYVGIQLIVADLKAELDAQGGVP